MSFADFVGIGEPPASAELAAIVPRETAVDGDGWEYDVATGEVLGRPDVPERFEVETDDAAEWALELRSRLEGDVAGVDARLEAVRKMLLAVRAEKVRRLSWWDWKFAPSLVAYARSKLAGKSRTAQFGWGKVAFRKVAGSHTIVDMPAAVEWVRTYSPERVKVAESVGVKDVLATIAVEARATGEEPARPSWLAHSDETESVTITTGIEVKLTGRKEE